MSSYMGSNRHDDNDWVGPAIFILLLTLIAVAMLLNV